MDDDSDIWDHAADVGVVGSGVAAGSAAATAASLGLAVLIVEKMDFPGGTTAKSGGVLWVPNNPLMTERGLIDDRSAVLRYLARTAYPLQYRPDHPTLGLTANSFELLEAFFDNGSAAIEHLRAIGAIDVELLDYPDYYADLTENEHPGGRALQPRLPDGWRRGVDPTGGQLLTDGLLGCAVRHGATLLTGHRVTDVVSDADGRMTGLIARRGRRTVPISCRVGLVFGSGGFVHDPELRRAFLRDPIMGSAAQSGTTGDFLRIGIGLGAQLGNMAHAWWDQVVVEHAINAPTTSRDVYYPFGDSMLIVNRCGRRVVNEKAVYNERAKVHFEWDPVTSSYPNLLLFMIWDEAVRRGPSSSRFRWPVPDVDEALPSFIARADTLEALADEFHRRLEHISDFTGATRLADDFVANLHDTVARFNAYAVDGFDPEFRRGESAVERCWAGEARPGMRSGSMAPIGQHGPFYGVILGAGALDTNGGPVINRHAQVMSISGHPIEGLYAAGNCVASPAGQAYWGPGGTIGPALVFGYIAGQNLASAVAPGGDG